MKNRYAVITSLVLALCNTVFASSGTIFFQGTIVNAPCNIPAETWMHYAQQPAAYKIAKQATPTPSCADATATQSVQVSRYISQTSSGTPSTPAKAIVTVVYN
ncbi:MAG: hypothetical protein JO338_09640 [Aquitalea sp.]|nr:hypothetical protein [Aquitalea sp.]